ncbi:MULTISPECIES: DUF2147 domain-containing protein [Rhodopseudomonas]|uniref:DUF2147 domain-containing protein n=1 Tax=Rhodopseudomonas TaxID=1073 RepID=UPI0005CACFFE|nr:MULTISPECIES: DUF2147 domain-containing protein [Rhodopseudomonas]MDF3809749.1 DUF2147 domain-containing protein [Rhodopseudomonas sp. BAL398]WOK20303.1 DUF2147 domain-containing protein [Rhodopseudomonas sp. BAL398]
MKTHSWFRALTFAAIAALSGLALFTAAPAQAAEQPSAAGMWQRSEDGKPVLWLLMLDRGGGMYEGVVAKTFPKAGTKEVEVCDECEDDRKGQPVLGISLIRDMKRNGLKYLGGNILDPRNGDIWKAQLTVSPDGQSLTLRGYVLTPALGKDETWQRLPDTAIAELDPAIIEKFLPEQAAAMKLGAAKPGAPKPSPKSMHHTSPARAAK